MNSPETQITLSPVVADAFVRFLKYHPASRVSKNLRNMFLEYLQSVETKDVQEMQPLLFDLEGLFGFLDVVEGEFRNNTGGAEGNPSLIL